MKINRGQLLAFLNLISLKGIDDEVKMRKLVNDCIIQVVDEGLICFGVDDTENIMFNHVYKIEYTEENEDPDVLIINDITKWVTYLQGLKGEEISISINDASNVLASGSLFYNIPISVPESISSYQRSDAAPLMPYTKNRKWYKIEDEDEKASPIEDWSEFNFNSTEFLESIGKGKNVDNMNLTLIVSKKQIGIEIGDINDPATPSFRNEHLDGVDNVSWTFKNREKLEWQCELGLHSIISSIDMLTHESLPSLFLKGVASNLIVRTNSAKLEGADIITTWAIGSPEEDEENYEDDDEEFDDED